MKKILKDGFVLLKNDIKKAKWFKTGCVVCVVLMVIYYVWRMYRYFPDQPPMSYYHYNLLRLLMDVAFGALK